VPFGKKSPEPRGKSLYTVANSRKITYAREQGAAPWGNASSIVEQEGSAEENITNPSQCRVMLLLKTECSVGEE